MKLFLQANDTFFFRDGKPFTKGDQSEGHSIFPHYPQRSSVRCELHISLSTETYRFSIQEGCKIYRHSRIVV